MWSPDQIVSAGVGAVALAFGARTLITKKAAFSSDDGETDFWFYGWRAILIGLLAIAISAICLASAFGLMAPSLDWL